MSDLIKPAAILFLICLIVSSALGLTYTVTKNSIELRSTQDAEAARNEVLPAADTFKIVDDWQNTDWDLKDKDMVKSAYYASKNQLAVGYVFDIVTKGYGGDIKLTIGIDLEQRVTGVKIGENKETPGLGSKVSDKPFLSQLVNLKPQQELVVVKQKKNKPEEIEAISGATITSKAVTRGVQAAINATKVLQAKGVNAK